MQRFLQTQHLKSAVRRAYRDAPDGASVLGDFDLRRLTNQVVQACERHINQIVARVVGNTEQREPFGRDLIAEFQ